MILPLKWSILGLKTHIFGMIIAIFQRHSLVRPQREPVVFTGPGTPRGAFGLSTCDTEIPVACCAPVQ